MQYHDRAEGASNDRALIATLAACTTFVVGYTLARVCLQRDPAAWDPNAQQMVVPHEATLWSDLAE